MEEKEVIKYSDLSPALKFLVVCCWVLVTMNVLAFVWGFVVGFLSVI